MLTLLSALVLAAAPLQDTAHVVLVATTDVHGRATDWDYVADRPFAGGLSRVASVVDSLRARYPGQVVVVDAGDLLQGDAFATYFARVTPSHPHPIVEAMNLAGYDAATPGNHDFDWGLPFLMRAVADARFPYVSANLFAARGDTLLFPAYRVVRRQRIRIAIAGFTTPGALVWNRDQLAGHARVAPIAAVAGPTLEAMRRDADVAVAVVHSGLGGRDSYDTTGVGEEHAAGAFAGLAARPDVVVVGHSHREIRDSVIGGVHFVQPRPRGASVSVVHLDLAHEDAGWRVRRIHADLVSTAGVAASPLLAQRLAPARDSVRAWVRSAIGLALAPMRAGGARAGPDPILDFVHDVQRRRTGAELSATSAFDLRAGFDPDTIRVAHVLGLYPFDNTLRAVRISGAQLKAYLEWSARYFLVDPAGRVGLNDSVPGYDYDMVAGAHYEIDLRRPLGDRIRGLSVRGRPVGPADSFTMAVNSHRLTGAGGYDMLRGAPVVYDKGERLPELLIDAVRTRSPIDPAHYALSDFRIVPEAADRAVRARFGLPARPSPKAARDTVLLRILATGDLHGAFARAAGPLAGALDSLADDCACAQLRLDAGDAMQGSPLQNQTRGRAGMELLAGLGYAAAALGDRDFDWPTDVLRQRLKESPYPWLAANVVDSVTGRRPDWIVPWRTLEVGGLSVAVIGYVTPDTKRTLPADRTRGLSFGEGELALHDVLAEVAARRPAATILLAHAGGACDAVACTGEIVRLAEQLGGRGVSLIVAGHTHQVMTTTVAGIPILQPGSGGSMVGVADLVKTPAGGLDIRLGVVVVDSTRSGGKAPFRAALELYRRRNDSLMARPLADMKRPLVRAGAQHPLGGLVAEARRNALRTDLGLVRTETIRADLPAGPVTYARLVAVEPARSELVRLTVTGAQVTALLERVLAGSDGPTAHLAGAQVRYDPRAVAGKRVRGVVLQGGRKLRDRDQLTLATDEASANGAGGLAPLAGLLAEREGVLDVEAVAALLRRLPQPVEVSRPAGFISTRR
ncbi:MAG: 5'-nucleotidase C-terminal domain-containing protein [Gemmatimonadales bacterium]|nr:5'-nucleotidase C-terminal domain-containing protein [Gemmatimonadales bacterium]